MRRLLVLAYYFPPSGGPGVQRTLRFVEHLPGLGWLPTVVTVRREDAAWPSVDEALCEDVPASVEVVRTRALDPYAGYARWTGKRRHEAVSVGFAETGGDGFRESVARWVRGNLFLPDARVGWVPFARKAALDLARGHGFDAVWSTGPPHSTHLAALPVARRLGLPWVVDVRDGWPDPTYAHRLGTSGPAARFDAAMRRRVWKRADAIVAVGSHLADSLRRETATPVHVIPNGYEERDFEGVTPEPHEGFVVRYTGNMPAERNPEALWIALSRIADRLPALRVELVGTIDASVREAVARAGLDARVRFLPQVPHADAVRAMVSADALLLVVNRTEGAEGIVTGKVFEYVASGRPVLGLGPVGGEADRVLRSSGAGALVDWDDADGLAVHLARSYGAWEGGTPECGASPDAARTFSRSGRSRELATLLDTLVEARGGRPA